MSLRVLRRALAYRAAIATTSLLAVGGVLALGASSAMADVVPVAGSLHLTSTAAAGGIGDPVSLNFQLATANTSTLVDPEQLDITLPGSFGLNTAAVLGATPVFGSASGGGYIGAPASSAKAIGTVRIVSAELEGTLGTSVATGKLYLVSGCNKSTIKPTPCPVTGYEGFGLEIAVPFGPLDIDFAGPLVDQSHLSTIEFSNLNIPNSVSGEGTPQPLPWSTFRVTMPRSTSVGLAGKCGAAGSLKAAVEDFAGVSSNGFTSYSKAVTVVCPPSLKGKVTKAKSGKPALSLTATARGGAFSSMTIMIPKALKLKSTHGIKVSGAKVKKIKKMGNNLEITFKSAAHKASVKISKSLRLNSKLVKKLKKHKKLSVTVKIHTTYGTSSAKIKL